jgi:hypothetical protein
MNFDHNFGCQIAKRKKSEQLESRRNWRREGDSNPRRAVKPLTI